MLVSLQKTEAENDLWFLTRSLFVSEPESTTKCNRLVVLIEFAFSHFV